MQNVFIDELFESSNQIKKDVNSLKTSINEIVSECETIEGAASTLNSYNGQLASSPKIEEEIDFVHNGLINILLGNAKYKKKVWSTWQITGVENITNAVQAITNSLAELDETLAAIGISAISAEISAENIDEYNKRIKETIESGTIFDSAVLLGAFNNLRNNITWDEYSAKNGKWSTISDEKIKYWTDSALTFEKDETTGAYLIKQRDSDGNWVSMGWTDEASALSYIKSLNLGGKKVLKDTNKKDKLDNDKDSLTDENSTYTKNAQTVQIDEKTIRELKNKKNRTNVEDAIINYYDELDDSVKSTVNENMFATVKKVSGENGDYYLTHIVIKDPKQIVVGNGNGGYGKGLETTSSMAKKAGATIAINGSHFAGDGSQDIYNTGTLKFAINNGKVVEDYGTSKGMEICIDKNGKIFSPAPGTSAQQLVDNGVLNSFSSHEANYIENGQILQWDSATMNKVYPRTIVGMVKPKEYVILTGNTSHAAAANILKECGCTYAASMDQGGSTTLVYENSLVNTPTDMTGERPVGDMVGFIS